MTGEEEDLRVRAARLDEALDLITGVWADRPTFSGEHYEMDLSRRGDLDTTGVCVQEPRVPIWVVGLWNRPKSMRRVTRFDGIVPQGVETPDDYREMVAWLRENGIHDGYDLVAEGETEPGGGADTVGPWAEAGATWWLEAAWGTDDQDVIRRRIDAGPPG